MQQYCLGKNHTSWALSVPAAKSQNFANFTEAQKPTKANFWYLGHYHKYETDYILEVWGNDCHLKKKYRRVTI